MSASLNKEFRVVYQPKDPEIYGKRRFAIGANQLQKYVGENNAKTALTRALNSRLDKCTVRFRKFGRIDFYKK